MDDLLIQIGKRLLERRKHLRLTQEELAEKADVTPQTISTAELGRKALRPENIIRISTALEVSTDYLLLGTITESDYAVQNEKYSVLTPSQYRHLENIVDSYIAAIYDERKA
jgi:Predicted transcriptional regulator with C-terminal CBS domains